MRALRVPIVIGLLFAVLWIAGTGAEAQQGSKKKYPPQTPTIQPSVLTPSPTGPPPASPSAPPSVVPSRGPEPSEPPDGDIPFTGADLTRFVLIGAALTGAGTLLVRSTRRLRHPEG